MRSLEMIDSMNVIAFDYDMTLFITRQIISKLLTMHYLFIFEKLNINFLFYSRYSGLMYKSNFSIRRIPEVVAHSGAALLHFFSDDAYNMSGFNISYRFDSCPTTDSCKINFNFNKLNFLIQQLFFCSFNMFWTWSMYR